MSCPTVGCQKHSWEGEEFICGGYSIEDSMKLRARATKISPILSGSVNGGRIMTIHEDARDKKRMFAEDTEKIAVFKTPQKTAGHYECRPFEAQEVKPRHVEDRFIHTYPLEMELAFCLPKFFKTWKRNMATNSGYRNRWRNEGFTAWLVNDLALKNARLQLDQLIMRGDYKSGIQYLSQFDGLIKKIYKYSREYVPEVIEITLPTLGSGDYVHIAVGGQIAAIPFNTNQITTINDIMAWLNNIKEQGSTEPYYSSTTNDSTKIWIAEKDRGWGVRVAAFVTQNATFDWAGTNLNCDGTTVVEVIQKSQNKHAPIKDDFGAINVTNFYEWISEHYYMLLNKFDRMEGVPANRLVMFISPEMKRIRDIAITKITKDFRGVSSIVQEVLGMQFAELPTLKGNEYFTTWAGNLQFATDLLSDLGTVDTWFDRNCKEFRMAMRAKAGVDILYPGEVVSNIPCLTNYNFGPVADTEVYQYPCKVDCGGNNATSCPDCEARFEWEIQIDETGDTSHIVIKNTSECPGTATVGYTVALSDAVGGSVTFTTTNADHTFDFSGATALNGLNFSITQTISNLGAGCADKTLVLGDTVDPTEATLI